MAKIFKPRRGLYSTMVTGSKKTTVLAAGELLVVSKGTQIGKGNKHNIYIGDGSTAMSALKPALYGDTSEEDITVTADSSSTSTAALANVVTGKTLGALIGSLKQAITKLNNEKASTSHTHSGYASSTHNHDTVYWKRTEKVSSASKADTATYSTNSGTATRATNDADGNAIKTTYAKLNNNSTFATIYSNVSSGYNLYFQKAGTSKGTIQANDAGLLITAGANYLYLSGTYLVYNANGKFVFKNANGTADPDNGCYIQSHTGNALKINAPDGLYHGSNKVLTSANFSLSGTTLTITT